MFVPHNVVGKLLMLTLAFGPFVIVSPLVELKLALVMSEISTDAVLLSRSRTADVGFSSTDLLQILNHNKRNFPGKFLTKLLCVLGFKPHLTLPVKP